MAKDFAKPFYNSKAWKECRRSFIAYRIKIDGGMCQRCRELPGYIVDHKEELAPSNIHDPNVTLNHNNLQFLCLECHTRKTFKSDHESIREGLQFDANGNIIQVP